MTRKSLIAFYSALILQTVLATPTVIEDDTVVVGDLSESLEPGSVAILSRHKREAYTTINGQQVLISCSTARNVNGECKPFGECYPIFKLRDSHANRAVDEYLNKDNENNVGDELRSIYRGVSGPCSDIVLETISEALGTPVPREKYVCCPTSSNFTKAKQPSRPPAPATAPDYQYSQCGRYFVDKSVDENITESTTLNGEEIETRIVNGRVAGRAEFPWAVALMLNGREFCGGSLIDDQHILTAAHCVYFMNRADVNRLRVQIGDHNIYSTSDGQHQVRGASNVYYHRGFSMRTLYDDVAVIRLGSPVNYNRFVQPICLTTNSYGLENYVANVAGWGQLSDRGVQSSVLRTVGVRVWKQPDCVNTYKGRAPAGISNGMLCAGGNGYDSCKGDSGGPLSVTRNSRAEQIGIVSWGIGCGSFPGVYTRIDQFLLWINKNRR